jgi:hypothetical protein
MAKRNLVVVMTVCLALCVCGRAVAQVTGKKSEETKPDIGKAAKEMKAAKGFHFKAETSVKAPGMPGDTGQGKQTINGQGINPALAHGTSGDGHEVASTTKTSFVKLSNTDKWITPPSDDARVVALIELVRFPFHAMREFDRLKKTAKASEEEKVGEIDCWVMKCDADKDYVKAAVHRIIKAFGETPVPLNDSMIDWKATSIVFKMWIGKDKNLPLKFSRSANVSFKTPMGSGSMTEETSAEIDFESALEDKLPADVLKKLGPNK